MFYNIVYTIPRPEFPSYAPFYLYPTKIVLQFILDLPSGQSECD